jgi:VWFA-related protein
VSCFRRLRPLCLLVPSLGAQTLSVQTPTFRVPARLVIAPTSVTDSHGRFVNGLSASDFSLYDNDVPQQIHEDGDFLPISVAVVIQTNLAARPIEPRISELGPLLGALVVGEGGEAAILTFDHKVRVAQDFTGDLGRLTHALRLIEFSYWDSRLLDASTKAIDLLKHRPDYRRRILLLISETHDDGSENKLRDAIEQAELNNVLIYSLTISKAHAALQGLAAGDLWPMIQQIYTGTKNLVVKNPLAVLTSYTGGEQYSLMNRASLEEAVRKMGEEIHGQYLLSFTPVNTAESGYHKIRVALNRSGWQVRSRPGYWSSPDVPADRESH